MRKIILASIVASTSLFATQGDNLIGLGSIARGMGGIGLGTDIGVDTVFKNPAFLTENKGFKSSFGGTLFMPDVTARTTMMLDPTSGFRADGAEVSSESDTYVIPEIAITDNINSNLAYGIGMFGVSGLGVDYRDAGMQNGLASMETNFQFMRMIPSIAYKMNDLSIGAGVSIAYGSLDMAAVMGNPMANIAPAQRGGGTAQDFGFGLQIGAGYQITSELSVGAFYQSEVNMEYKNVFDFNMDGAYQNLKLSQPAEYGIGFGYKRDNYKIGLDYKRISWSDADGYDNFGWEDQDVYAIGGEYNMGKLTLRAGFNYGKAPIDETFEGAPVSGVPYNEVQMGYFNLVGFPALSEEHYSLGFGYELSKKLTLDMAYTYAPEAKVTYNIDAMMGGGVVEATNTQDAITFGLTYSF